LFDGTTLLSSAGDVMGSRSRDCMERWQEVAKAREWENAGFTCTSTGGPVFIGSVISVKMTNSELY